MTQFAINFIGYVNGVHTVIIKNDTDNPLDSLLDGYTVTKYNLKSKQSCEIKSFLHSIGKKVNHLPKRKQNKLIKMVATIPITIIPFLSMKKTDAQVIQVDFPFFSDNKDESIIPVEIWDILKQLVSSGGEIGFWLSILLISVAGILIMLGRKEKAITWITEIIKGYGIILVAPFLILLLTVLVYLLLGNVSGLDMFY